MSLFIFTSGEAQAMPVAYPSASVAPKSSPSIPPKFVWEDVMTKCSPDLKSPSTMTCDVCGSNGPTTMSGLGGQGACGACIAVCERQTATIPYPDRWYLCATTCLAIGKVGCAAFGNSCTGILNAAKVPGGALVAKTATELCLATYLQVCAGN